METVAGWQRVVVGALLIFGCIAHGDSTAIRRPNIPTRPGLPFEDLKGHEPPGEALFRSADYNKGRYGRYVPNVFKTSNLTAPRLNVMHDLGRCDDGSYTFLAPRGNAVTDPTAAIYDSQGSLIWAPEERLGELYNLQVQQYKGQPHIVYWTGDNNGGHGRGFYYMLDQHYRHVRNISAPANFRADLHSFSITADDTAIVTAYQLAEFDMDKLLVGAPIGGARYVWDCLFMEFDLETNKVLFQWRATDHVPLIESYAKFGAATKEKPWDYFHINMVEKDADGNYLVSSRHLRSILYISGLTGKVLWKLGGKDNQFKDLSHGKATQFVGQHDVHWYGDRKYITMFDNRADWSFQLEHVSKGRRIELDTQQMTARVDAEYLHPEKLFTFSQGSYQTLPNGNVLLGYGFTGAFAEFSPGGKLLCDAYFQPSSRFMTGDVQSYRVMKFNWTGLPDTRPVVKIDNSTLYVSWLGSTEVRRWMIQDSLIPEDRFGKVLIFEKTGFETTVNVSTELPLRRYVRLVALDKESRWLESSDVLDLGALANVTTERVYEEVNASAQIAQLERQFFMLGALLGFILLVLPAAAILLWPAARGRMLACLSGGSELREEKDSTYATWKTLLSTPWQKGWLYKPVPVEHDDP